MALRINDTVPDFAADTNQGKIRFHEWIGDGWAILFSHPKDFTPVCTTEFGAVAQLADEWAKRGTKVMGVSVDGVEDHVKWIGDIETAGGARVGFPIAADKGLEISKAFDMLPAEAYLPDGRTPNDTATVRSVFIIGPDKKLKLTMTYPMTVGRNFAEVLRAGRVAEDLQPADRDARELAGRTGRDRRAGAEGRRGRGEVRQAGQEAALPAFRQGLNPDAAALIRINAAAWAAAKDVPARGRAWVCRGGCS
jgi:alkyl hydroperoxide reductase subunit AhpC